MDYEDLKSFCIKAALFLLSLLLLLWFCAARIHAYQVKYEPRTSLFTIIDKSKYPYALIGDSAFCSYYVSNDRDSIWNKFETFTKRKCFPGAVDNMAHGDFINAIKLITRTMPAHSTVFINILPHRFLFHDISEQTHYDAEFADVQKKMGSPVWRLVSYLKLDYSKYGKNIINGKTTDRKLESNYDKIWNVDGNFARINYAEFITRFNRRTGGKPDNVPHEEIKPFFDEITGYFNQAGINVVFVLMPLNKTLVYDYSNNMQADQVYTKLSELKNAIKLYLNRIDAPYIDLFDAVPSDCFADLVHTNAHGDEIIARALAKFTQS